MEGLIDATLTLLTDPVALLIFACAMGGGLVAGIIPGLSTTALAVIVLPLTAAQPLPYVMVMYGTLFISGVAGRHLAHAEDGRQTASPNLRRSAVPSSATFRVVLSGVIGAMLAVLLTEGLAGYVFFGFKAPEVFCLAFFALAVVAGAASRTGVKGWLALLLGLLLGLSVVGPITDSPRYVFGGLDILATITFVPLLIGFVVVPGMIDAATNKLVVLDSPSVTHTTLSAAATNAALLPLVAFGLPLSVGAVVMIAAVGLQGMEFRPLFLIAADEAGCALLASAVWASIFAPLVGDLMTSGVLFLRKIPGSVVGAGLFVIAVAGVYTLDAGMHDVYTMLACGLAAYLLRQQGYPLAFIILGIVLTQIAEPAFANVVSLPDAGVLEMLHRPVSAVLIASGLVVMAAVAMWRVGPPTVPEGEETDDHAGR